MQFVAILVFISSAIGGSSALRIPALTQGTTLDDYVPVVCQLLTEKVLDSNF